MTTDHESKARSIAESVLHGKFHFPALVPAIAEALREAEAPLLKKIVELSAQIQRVEEINENLRSAVRDQPIKWNDEYYEMKLKEARLTERREIMNLLGMDANGNGLTTTSSWLTPGDVEAGHDEITICHDPYYELEGALIDLRRQGADKICISTIEKVQEQLAAVSKRARGRNSTDG